MVSSLDLSQFFEVFLEESEELLSEMESLLLAIDISSPGQEECNAIFRTAHSVKGGAATFGLTDMVELAHIMESLLDDIRKGAAKLTEDHVSAFLQAKDMLKRQLNGHRQKQPIANDASSDVLALLQKLLTCPPPSFPPMGGNAVELATAVDRNKYALEGVSGELTGRMPETVLARPYSGLRPILNSTALGGDACRLPSQAPYNSGQDSTYIRVNLKKVDQLINLVGELVITQAMIEQQLASLDWTRHGDILDQLDSLARNTHELQELVLSIRMMPMDLVFSRFPRMVRELAGKLGKKVRLCAIGGATQLDKGLIERIIDPLTHLVRNSIDHGIEEPSLRLANNKDETGTITLSAIQEAGRIQLQVIDDGAGLDRGRIMQKARDYGISVSETMSDEELWEIISAPGFTTEASITEVSGRGVGMDVVKRNIASMGGSVHIQSTWGQGTTVTISLPLTLAIFDGMTIKAGEEVYILPLLAVVECFQSNPKQIYEITGKGRVILVREEYIPLIYLHDIFGIQPKFSNPKHGMVVVVEGLGKKAALLVDSLMGQQQIVVKNIGSNYRNIPGISGATILGDGSVSLILDVPSLIGIRNYFDLKQALS